MRLTLIFIFSSALFCQGQEAVTGRWEGSVKIPDRELKLIVDLAQESGGWIGSFIIPGLDVKGTALADITVKNSEVFFAVKSGRGLEATFKAHLNPDGTLTGDFVQAGNTAQFILKKMGPPQVELPQRSTAITKDVEGEWKGEYEVFGYPRYVSIKLANHGADGATAEFVVVGKKTNNLPVDLVTQEGDLLTINSHETGISYEGRFQKEEIRGTFNQAGIELPLVLRRTR